MQEGHLLCTGCWRVEQLVVLIGEIRKGVVGHVGCEWQLCWSFCMGMEQPGDGVKLVGETSGHWWRSAARRAVHGVLSGCSTGEEKSGWRERPKA